MAYIIGATLMLCFFICLGISAYIGYMLGKKQKPVVELTEEQKREIERKRKGFQAVMDYSLEVAMGRKKT